MGAYDLHLFISYLVARRRKEQEELAYKIYLTDVLSGLAGVETRFYDLLCPPESIDANQVIEDVIKRAGLVLDEPIRSDGEGDL